MGTESRPLAGLPVELLDELSGVMLAHGYDLAPAREVAAAVARVVGGALVLPLGHAPGVDPTAPAGYCGVCVGLWETDAERDAAHAGVRPELERESDLEFEREPEAVLAPALTLVPVDEPAVPDRETPDAGAAPDRAAADALRRAMRWQQVADAVAAGLAAPPGEVRISDDGWSLTLTVAKPGQVAAWASALAAGEPEVRVYSPARGAVVRETSASISHPMAVRVACVQALPVPAPPARVAVAADEVAVA